MFKNLTLILSSFIIACNLLTAQNIQPVHQLTQSCFISTDGKVIINAGGHYTTAVSEQVQLRDSVFSSIFDTVNSTFKNSKKCYYSYDAGGLLTESASISIDKNGVSWSPGQQVSFKYTGFQLFDETNKSWDKTLTGWVTVMKYKYSYESDNSLSAIFNMPWDADSAEFKYSTK